MLTDSEQLARLGLALAIGLVVGIERGWRQREVPEGGRTAGVRTFALIGLFGGVTGLLSDQTGEQAAWIAPLVLLSAVFAVFSYRENQAGGQFSVTNLIAAMVVFALGVAAAFGMMRAAAAAAVVVAAVLASRSALHQLVERLTWIEFRAALLLLAMTAVIWPLLPNRAIDPLGALNPSELWLLMILTGAVSYVGYIGLKIAGPDKGLPVAGLAGGLASSTATTIAFARQSRLIAQPDGLAAGVALASAVSLARVTLLIAVVQPALLWSIGPPAAASAVVFVLGALVLLRRRSGDRAGQDIGVPFELSTVLGFGVILVVVSLAGAWAVQELGDSGAYVFAALSGLVDVDAVTLSAARASYKTLALDTAAGEILTALATNLVQRVVYARVFGSQAFAIRLGAASALALLAGVIIVVVMG